jgi:hypothetical protein
LSALDGVDIGIASAIMALTFPEDYPVLDFRGWRQAYGEARQNFGISHYARYTETCVHLAVRLGAFPQEVDLALWAMDIARKGHPLPPREEPKGGIINMDEDPFNADWIKFRALDRHTLESFLSEFGSFPADEFKRLPIYHMNKYRNQWVRTLDW